MKIVVSYVLINTLPEKEHEIYNQLLNEARIIELRPLFKEHDMIAKIKTENYNKLEGFVKNKIKLIEGIVDTKTIR
jgi:DNA-binding Lrp family transcriptional regulator